MLFLPLCDQRRTIQLAILLRWPGAFTNALTQGRFGSIMIDEKTIHKNITQLYAIIFDIWPSAVYHTAALGIRKFTTCMLPWKPSRKWAFTVLLDVCRRTLPANSPKSHPGPKVYWLRIYILRFRWPGLGVFVWPLANMRKTPPAYLQEVGAVHSFASLNQSEEALPSNHQAKIFNWCHEFDT